MRRIRRSTGTLVVASLLAGGVVLSGPDRASADDAVRTPDHAVYVVELTSAARGRDWAGTASVTFDNTGTTALDVVWFRLWANAGTGCEDPAIVVDVTAGGIGGALEVGCTALPITLPAPLGPGATATVELDLAIHLPAANDRLGWHDGTGRLGNALPILAVNDDEGWHLEPPFDRGESFYSLVSDWTVSLRVPPGLETPATGSIEDVTPDGGREVRTIVAADVRDFAWAAGDFDLVRARDARGVRVRLWYPILDPIPGGGPRPVFISRERARALAGGAAHDLDVFSDAFGAYPYEELDVVITTFSTFGGMEYPQLVLSVRDKFVIAHEIAHQWWFGIVGNDQYEDPWIDEGFAQWSMFLPFDRLGTRRWPPLPFVGCSMFEWPNPEVRLSSGIDHFSAHPLEYWIPYWQGACALARLAKHLGGLEPLLSLLRGYAEAHWLGVATNQDVMDAIAAAVAELGVDLDPARFFDRWRISRPAP